MVPDGNYLRETLKCAEDLSQEWLLIFQKVCEKYDDVPSPEEYTYGAMDSYWVESLCDFIATETEEDLDYFRKEAGIVSSVT